MSPIDLIFLVVVDAFWSAVAAVGFAMVFNVPRRYLPACLLCAAVGHGLRTLVMQFDISIEFGTLFAATVVGFMAVFFAQRLQAPAMLFAIPGIIPMIPGSFAYRAMIGLVSVVNAHSDQAAELLVQASTNFIRVGLILAALGVGIAVPGLLFQRQKPVV
jgi:uncharacterized membrane protein YjjB (DUF3815 family)